MSTVLQELTEGESESGGCSHSISIKNRETGSEGSGGDATEISDGEGEYACLNKGSTVSSYSSVRLCMVALLIPCFVHFLPPCRWPCYNISIATPIHHSCLSSNIIYSLKAHISPLVPPT
jgi:hypothetical protein